MNSIREKNLKIISGFEFIPKGWSETTVEDICDIGRGRVISQDEIKSKPGIYPVYSSQTRENGKMGAIESYDFNGDYVTWTTDGENAGTVFFRSGKFNCTNVCGTLKAKNIEEVDLEFLSYHLGRIAKKYVSYIGNPKLMNGVMANVGLVIPNIKSQKKITKILTTIDQLIEKTQALIDKHTAIKLGMMADLFTRGIDLTTGQLRPPVEQAPHLYKETELGWIPKEWSCESIRNRIDISYGKSQIDVRDKDGDIPVYGTGGLIEYANTPLFDKDSILIGRKGTLNNPFFVKAPFWVVDTAYYVNNFINGDIHFLSYMLSQFDFAKLNESTGVPSLNRETIYREKLAFPALHEQLEITKRLSSVDGTIKANTVLLKKTKMKKSGLMQDLLTGKVGF